MQERNALENKDYKKDDNEVWLANFPRNIRRKLADNEKYTMHAPEMEHRFSAINQIDSDKVVSSEYYQPYNYKHLRKRSTYSTGQIHSSHNSHSSKVPTPISGKTPQDRFLDGAALGKDLWAFYENEIDNKLSAGSIKVSTNKSFVKKPIFMDGLEYSVIIGDGYIYIGCQGNTIEKWKEMPDKEIMKMDGKKSLSFWRKYKSSIINLAETHCAEEE